MEKLKGIRRLYRRGSGQGAPYRGRMNSWTFREVQRQIEYKAGWEGIPITYVSPRHTSRNCSKCGTSQRFEGRMVICPSCGKVEDRDVNASRNIMMMAAQVLAAQPPGGGGEGEPRRQEKAGNPPSGEVEVDPAISRRFNRADRSEGEISEGPEGPGAQPEFHNREELHRASVPGIYAPGCRPEEGRGLHTVDAIVYATGLQRKIVVVTGDQHFKNLPGVEMI